MGRKRQDGQPSGSEPTQHASDVAETRTHGAEPSAAFARPDAPAEIGGYRILGKLGEGGMGVVYEAEQQSPRRSVALKVIRGGALVDDNRLRMFQREADTLARLEHPHIAAIYESGRTEDGQHFFAMELVRGPTLSEYIAARRIELQPAEIAFRLGLFHKLCRAVHYAHQRGVIHRDLKPNNVIVVEGANAGELPELKVLDFGLARITDADVAAASMITEVGVIKGTLPYMSPEQARGIPEEIDIRSDVYALGVILYEMLTGARPLDLTSQSLVETVRVICEGRPKRLRDAWTGRGQPDEDLETIVGKALEKTADRRYSGAAALSEDVQRYLTAQPILARPPSSTYLVRKFAQRNRVLVGGVLATIAVLAAGVIVSTVFGIREARQRHAAEAARDDLATVVDFQSKMISEIDPERAGQQMLAALRERIVEVERQRGGSAEVAGESLAALEEAVRDVSPTDFARGVLDQNILEPAARALDSEFEQRPEIEARLRETIGNAYRDLGMLDLALPQLTRAVDLGKRSDETTAGVGRPAELLAEAHFEMGDFVTAGALFLQLYEKRARAFGENHPETLRAGVGLANVAWKEGRVEEAVSLYRRSLDGQLRELGEAHADTAYTMNNLAVVHFKQGRNTEAESLWVTALKQRRDLLGSEDVRTLETMTNLAGLYWSEGGLDRAEALFAEALAIQRRSLGDNHPVTLRARSNLATVYKAMGRFEEAIRLQRETLEARRQVHGDRHPMTLRSMNNLATALTESGRYQEAAEVLTRLIDLDGQVQPGSAEHAVHLHSLGELRIATADFSSAAEPLHRALEIYLQTDHRYAGLALYQLAGIAASEGRREEALDLLRRALDRGHTRGWDAEAPEFERLRGDPTFEALVADAEKAANSADR